MKHHLKLSLRENANSFLEDALANAVVAEEEPQRWKFAVLSMVQAIELSLKQLLYEVHPLFVYENVDKATKTVGLDHAVKRLSQVSNLRLTPDEAEALKVAKDARDKITHYEVNEEVAHLKLAFARLLGFLADFYAAHFEAPLYDEVEEKLWSRGIAVRMYGEELHSRAMRRAEAEVGLHREKIISCCACSWKPMVVREDGDATCFVCGYRTEIVYCARCEEPINAQDASEASGKQYCESCLEYVTADYWYEQRAGK